MYLERRSLSVRSRSLSLSVRRRDESLLVRSEEYKINQRSSPFRSESFEEPFELFVSVLNIFSLSRGERLYRTPAHWPIVLRGAQQEQIGSPTFERHDLVEVSLDSRDQFVGL